MAVVTVMIVIDVHVVVHAMGFNDHFVVDDRRRDSLVYVANVVNVNVVDVVVVVGDVIDVRNARVANIDRLKIISADMVIRDIRLAISEREPAHSDAGAADPGHERRRIAGTHPQGSRDPAPSSSHKHPAAIMERSESPRRVVDPGPTPRFDPGPMSIAVRRPSRFDPGGKPHAAVSTNLSPGAILIEVFVSNHVG